VDVSAECEEFDGHLMTVELDAIARLGWFPELALMMAEAGLRVKLLGVIKSG